MASPVKFLTPVPLRVDLGNEKAQAMISILKATPLPAKPVIPGSTPSLGIDLDFLKEAKERFEQTWKLAALQQKINQWPNYTVHYDHETCQVGGELHYVHVRSSRKDAVPLILMHGWPGSFFDFNKVIEPLVNPPEGHTAFHVVVPSIPGFTFSTLPPTTDWDPAKTAQVYHGLMTDVLGYSVYAAQGGDWGSMILKIMGYLFPESIKVLHFNMYWPSSIPKLDTDTPQLSDAEKGVLDRRAQFASTGRGYFLEQSTKPFTIGLAIASSPLAMLAWIGEKFYAWSDPRYLDIQDLLDTVALYWLTGSFASSVMIYNQATKILQEFAQGGYNLKGKIGFSLFPYEGGAVTRNEFQQAGNVVFYEVKNKGGHFAALDNPEDFVKDLRAIVSAHW